MSEFPLLSDERIEQGRQATFSTNNPFCPCDRKTMQKAVRWAENESRAPLLAEIERQNLSLLNHQEAWVALSDFCESQASEIERLSAEVERLKADAEGLLYLEREANELRTVATGEDDFDWVVISNHMDKPYEREVGRGKTVRKALDAARAQGGE